jgi:predicted metal-dependent phosphoesterase TrpH
VSRASDGGFDLHVHTTCSDGTEEVEDVIALAASTGLDGLAITDHDTTAGFDRARDAAEQHGLELVLGTEFSAELDGWSVHVLGYDIDPGDAALVAELDRLRGERTGRARRIVERFNDLGIAVAFERVAAIAGDAPIGRPHIAAAVVEAGGAATEREVFDRFLADGGPAYVAKHAVTPLAAVGLLRAAGGLPVLAHPGIRGPADGPPVITDELIEELAAAGLAGLEADHPDHDEPTRRRFRDLARALGLVVTAGSDYHGDAKPNRLGEARTARGALEALRS